MQSSFSDQPPAFGDLVLQEQRDASGRQTGLTVVHADPTIAVTHEVYEALTAPGPCVAVCGDLVRITATNGVWLYRITEYLPSRDMYVLQLVATNGEPTDPRR